jgi:hypothetical protein
MKKTPYLQNKYLKEAYIEWIFENLEACNCEIWNIVLTFKKALARDDGALVFLSDSEADKAVKYFLSKLNKAVYKNGYKRFDNVDPDIEKFYLEKLNVQH